MSDPINIVCSKCEKDVTLPIEEARKFNKNNKFVCIECNTPKPKVKPIVKDIYKEKEINPFNPFIAPDFGPRPNNQPWFGDPYIKRNKKRKNIFDDYYYSSIGGSFKTQTSSKTNNSLFGKSNGIHYNYSRDSKEFR